MIKIRERRYPSGRTGLQADIHGVTRDGAPFRRQLQVPSQVRGRAAALRWAEEQRRRLERGEEPATPRTRRATGPADRSAAAGPPGATVAQAAAWWLEDGAVRRWSPTTIALRRRLCADHLEPVLGGRPVAELDAGDVRRLRLRLAGCAPSYERSVLRALRSCLAAAQARGVAVGAVPIEYPRVRECAEPRTYDVGAFERLVRAAAELGPRHLAVVLLCGESGLRLGEVLGLQVADAVAGAATGLLRVERTRTRLGPGVAMFTKGPKNDRVRTVPVSPRTRSALRAVVAAHPQGADGGAWLITRSRSAGLLLRRDAA